MALCFRIASTTLYCPIVHKQEVNNQQVQSHNNAGFLIKLQNNRFLTTIAIDSLYYISLHYVHVA